MPSSTSARLACLIVTVPLALGACTKKDEAEVPSLTARAETVRELRFISPVGLREIDPSEDAAEGAAFANQIDDETIRLLRDNFGRVGFFTRDLDLRSTLAQTYASHGAYYSIQMRNITVVGQASEEALIHEYVHALQDQHFDLQKYQALGTSDSRLARQAVVEGDAVLAAGRFSLEKQGKTLAKIDVDAMQKQWVTFSETLLDDAKVPLYFAAYTSFTYAYGLAYVGNNLLGPGASPEAASLAQGSFQREDLLFSTRPPTSTAEVLGEGDALSSASGVGLGASSLGAAVETTGWDRLGEWLSYLLFRPALGPSARAVASGWKDDALYSVRDQDTGNAAILWISEWDTESAAADAEKALRFIHYGPLAIGAQTEPLAATDGEIAWIERRKTKLVLIKNISRDRVETLATAAFGPAARIGSVPLRVVIPPYFLGGM